MNSGILTVVLSVGLILTTIIFLESYSNNYMLPGNDIGYEPVQPIAYSHRLHAGELGIPCLHCHFGAEKSRNAGVPPLNVCMNCHRFVSASFIDIKGEENLANKEKRNPRPVISPEIRKIYNALGFNDKLAPDPAKQPRPIVWNKIHNLPDFVYFNHSTHVSAGVDCQTCHGSVETMERVRQVYDLSMGWCVNCHRRANTAGIKGKQVYASTDCSACHY